MSKLNTVIELIKNKSHSLTGIFEKGVDHCRHKLDRESTIDPEANESALTKAVDKCREEIERSDQKNKIPSPKYFEHVAMLSRQTRNYQNEIAICELYLETLQKHSSKYKFSKRKIEKEIRPLCETMMMRIHNAKTLSEKQI